jgi:hypothetical protein
MQHPGYIASTDSKISTTTPPGIQAQWATSRTFRGQAEKRADDTYLGGGKQNAEVAV